MCIGENKMGVVAFPPFLEVIFLPLHKFCSQNNDHSSQKTWLSKIKVQFQVFIKPKYEHIIIDQKKMV
jgi:hypothetical protein